MHSMNLSAAAAQFCTDYLSTFLEDALKDVHTSPQVRPTRRNLLCIGIRVYMRFYPVVYRKH